MNTQNDLSILIQIICAVLILTSCNTAENNAPEYGKGIEKLTSYYNYRIKNSDSLANPEILLELTIKNDNKFGVMIKYPTILIVDVDKSDTTYFDEVFVFEDIDKIPTQRIYEDSVTSEANNPLFHALERYILDSIKRENLKLNLLENNELYGYCFVHPLQKSIFPLNLTTFLDRHSGRFKIFAYYDTVRYNYQVPVVPLEFRGYKKIAEGLKFDTFYLESNRK